MIPLGQYGIGLLADCSVIVAANIGGTNAANDCVVPFVAVALLEQFVANDGDGALGTVIRIGVRGSYTVAFQAGFNAHADTVAIIMGVTKNTDAAGLTSTFAMATLGRQYIAGTITAPLAAAVLPCVSIGGGFVVEDSEAEATALGGAGAGALMRAHCTIAGDTHPTANAVTPAQIALWHMKIERMGDIQGIARP